MLFLVHDGKLHAEATEADARLVGPDDKPLFDIREVPDGAIGWVEDADGTFTAPPIEIPYLLDCATARQRAILAVGVDVNVAAAGEPAKVVLCDGTASTRADLAMLALFGQANPTGTQTWIGNDGTVTVLTGTELVALATNAGLWIAHTYAQLAAVRAGISASPPTITDCAQIDAAFATTGT